MRPCALSPSDGRCYGKVKIPFRKGGGGGGGKYLLGKYSIYKLNIWCVVEASGTDPQLTDS